MSSRDELRLPRPIDPKSLKVFESHVEAICHHLRVERLKSCVIFTALEDRGSLTLFADATWIAEYPGMGKSPSLKASCEELLAHMFYMQNWELSCCGQENEAQEAFDKQYLFLLAALLDALQGRLDALTVQLVE